MAAVRATRYRAGRRITSWLVGAAVLLGHGSTGAAQTGGQGAGLTLMEAVEATLSRQPNLALERESVRGNEGILQERKGLFDPMFSVSGGLGRTDRSLPAGSLGSRQTTDTTFLEFFTEKKLRSGVVLKPSVSLNRTEDSLLIAADANYAVVALTLTAPLLRGRGEGAVAGLERAAQKEYEASLRQLRHTTAALVMDTVTAYWTYVSAAVQAREARNSEGRADEYLRLVKALIAGDELAGAELDQVTANLEARSAQRISGELALREARQLLGLAMGLSGEEIDRLPEPTDAPPAHSGDPLRELPPSGLVGQALTQRDDYRVALAAVEAAAILLEAERNGCLPELDLELSAGYTGLREGSGASRFFGALGGAVPGPSASALLTYRWPAGNNAARGRLLQREAVYRQTRLAAEDLSRKISSSVSLALAAVSSNGAAADRLGRSVSLYEQALANELKKARMGVVGFLNVMDVEDRLRDAIQSASAARAGYAVALARLRFQLGSLLSGEGERAFVRREDLTSLPQESHGGRNP